jgi:hypothetical protein
MKAESRKLKTEGPSPTAPLPEAGRGEENWGAGIDRNTSSSGAVEFSHFKSPSSCYSEERSRCFSTAVRLCQSRFSRPAASAQSRFREAAGNWLFTFCHAATAPILRSSEIRVIPQLRSHSRLFGPRFIRSSIESDMAEVHSCSVVREADRAGNPPRNRGSAPFSALPGSP